MSLRSFNVRQDEGKQNVSLIAAVFLIAASIVTLSALVIVEVALPSKVAAVSIEIESDDTRMDIAANAASALEWEDEKMRELEFTLRRIQWDALRGDLTDFLADEYEWTDEERESFLTRTDMLLQEEEDMLLRAYVPATYVLDASHSPALIAETIVGRIREEHSENMAAFLDDRISESSRMEANNILGDELLAHDAPQFPGFLPDIVPLPPQDISIRETDGRRYLVFSTTYYNSGRAPLELFADPELSGIREDHERAVLQRIYQDDGTALDREVGTFLWHQEHLHYHYSDFVDYVLEPIEVSGDKPPSATGKKSTFCIRDVSRIDIDGIDHEPAEFQICGKERQGISIGWGDTYFHTYGDQNLDITGFPSGAYRLSFIANPKERLIEETKENNTSSAVIAINMETGTVEVQELSPQDHPKFEHIHIEQSL